MVVGVRRIEVLQRHLAVEVALIGPIFTTTVAVISVRRRHLEALAAGNGRLQDFRIVQRFPDFLQGCGNAFLAFDHQSHEYLQTDRPKP